MKTSQNSPANKFDKKEYLKQIALCECIYDGLGADSLMKKDNSTWGAMDLCDCSPDFFRKIDSLSKIAANSILPIQPAEDSTKRPIIADCTEFYKSKKLDSLIKTFKIN